jgi:hypothetical protein
MIPARGRTTPPCAGLSAAHAGFLQRHARTIRRCAGASQIYARATLPHAGTVQMCAGIIPAWQKPSKTLVFHEISLARLSATLSHPMGEGQG